MHNEDPSSHDAQTLDSATADQAKEQEKANFPEMHSDEEDEEEDSEMKFALLEENDELPVSDAILQSRVSHEGNQGRRGVWYTGSTCIFSSWILVFEKWIFQKRCLLL